LEKARSGDMAAIKELADRLDGNAGNGTSDIFLLGSARPGRRLPGLFSIV